MARFFKGVFGTQPKKPAKIEVNVDTVYIRDNITQVISENEMDMSGWKYDEAQYSIREFQETVGKDTSALKVDVVDVAETLASTFTNTSSLGETLGEVMMMNLELMARLEALETLVASK